jgi:hypothetical protein
MTNKTIIKFTLALIFSSAFTFCKKEKVSMIKVSGFVFNSSKQPVSGQEVIIEAYEIIPSAPNLEFPGGGSATFRKQKTYTDSRGSYSFKIYENLMFPAEVYLGRGEYSGEISKCYPKPGGANPACPNCLPEFLPCTNYFDTVFAEEAGYIRFTIKNTGSSFLDDSLFITKSSYARHSEYLGLSYVGLFKGEGKTYIGNEMAFSGVNVNKVIIDTIPAESTRKQYIEWTYKRADIISVQHDSITVSPGAISDYTIAY